MRAGAQLPSTTASAVPMFDRLLPRLRHGGAPAADAAASAPDWSRLRAPPSDQDRVLLSHTHLWLRSVPTSLHPKHLCRYHPRIANRFAQLWDDHERIDRLFEELSTDKRGRRKGFSDRVAMELRRLERFHSRRPRHGRALALSERLRSWTRGADGADGAAG